MKKATTVVFGIVALVILLMVIIPHTRFIPNEIVKDPSVTLHKASVDVEEIDEETRMIVNELKSVIKKVDGFWGRLGLGMAAPQIGYNKRILVLRTGKNQYQEMINPRILEKKRLFPTPQMCFSTKGMHILNRFFWYDIEYMDLHGNKHRDIIKGRQAATLNQELDHLDGVLITD